MIAILSLSPKQRALADILWQIDSSEAIQAFISALRPLDQREAQTIMELMVLAHHDAVDSVCEAESVLNRIRER